MICMIEAVIEAILEAIIEDMIEEVARPECAQTSQDAPKTCQDCPRHPKTPQKRPQDLSEARLFSVWESRI